METMELCPDDIDLDYNTASAVKVPANLERIWMSWLRNKHRPIQFSNPWFIVHIDSNSSSVIPYTEHDVTESKLIEEPNAILGELEFDYNEYVTIEPAVKFKMKVHVKNVSIAEPKFIEM